MNDTPLISIITITFNAAATLRPTLQSVKEQTWQDFEHIIIDGASHDDTVAIAKAEGIEGGRIVSEPDKGLYDAMNKGLRMARGEYVLFLNSGDSFADKSVLEDYAVAALQADADIVYSDTALVDASRKVVGKRHLSAPERLTQASFKKGMLVCHQAFMVKRKLTVPYDLSYRFSADYDWCVKCLDRSNPESCINLNRIGIHYLNEGVTTANHRASLKERFHIMAKHFGLLPTIIRHIGFILKIR